MSWKPDYLTLQAAKDFIGLPDTVDDVEVAGWVTASSRAVDKATNRQFGNVATPVTRTYRRTPYYDQTTGMWLLEIDDVQSSTGMTINGTAFASAGVTLLPDNAAADGKPYERIGFINWPIASTPGMPISNAITTDKWGWAAVPAQVPMACKLQINRWNSRRTSPMGVAGSPEQGSELRLLARLDPDVATTLMGLSRRRRVG